MPRTGAASAARATLAKAFPMATEPVNTAPATVYRHPLPVRIAHWLNVVFLAVMVGSGLQIFNAHPALYWGERSDPERALLRMDARRDAGGELRGVTELFGTRIDTTGTFGVSEGRFGATEARGFPTWATIPSGRWLAMGRRWHFFFAWLFVLNGAFYVAYTLASAERRRRFFPDRSELRHLGGAFAEHLRWRRLRAQALAGYNVLQKLSYVTVVLLLGPLVVLTGLAMSPWLNSVLPLPELFAGRQSARTIHFLVAFAFVAFVVVHLLMVLLVGPWNHVRAMITGRLRLHRGT